MPQTSLSKEAILGLFHLLKIELPQSGQKISTKFAFASNYTLSNLEPICLAIAEAAKSNSDNTEYDKYIKEMIGSIKLYCATNKDGKLLMSKNGMPLIKSEFKDTVTPLINELNIKYKDVIEKKKKDDDEIESMLKETIDVEIIKVKFVNVPEWLNQNQLKIIRHMIIEDDIEIKKLLMSE